MGSAITSIKLAEYFSFCRSGDHSLINAFQNQSFDHFEIDKIIAYGSQGEVYKVTDKRTNKSFAMKIIKKDDAIKINQIQSVAIEMKIMLEMNSPFILKLKHFLEDKTRYGFVTNLLWKDLHQLQQTQIKFQETSVILVTAEIILGLQHLHQRNYIYRDLKPENILIDNDGHIKLTDFGISRQVHKNPRTFSGTREYCAPEVILAQTYGFLVDYWSLGIIIHELLTGHNPFMTQSGPISVKSDLHVGQNDIYQNIINGKMSKEMEGLSHPAQSIISGLLQSQPQKRLGSQNGIEEIKNHPFFATVDWEKVKRKEYSPLTQYTSNQTSTSNTNTPQEHFLGFSLDNRLDNLIGA